MKREFLLFLLMLILKKTTLREEIFAEDIFAVENSKSREIRGIYFRVPCPYHKLRGIYFRVSSCISEFLLYFIASFVIKYDDKLKVHNKESSS